MNEATRPDTTLAHRLAQLPPDRRAELARRLRAARPVAAADPGWFIRHHRSEAATMRLFCFSYTGSGASIFHGWSDLLPDQVEVCAIQLPGRETRVAEPAYRRLGPLVADLQAAVEPLLDKPFAFFGHSMGALVAFELARQLRRAGLSLPEQLFLSAFRAPQLPNLNIRIYHLPDEVLKTVLLKEGTPAEVLENAELMAALLPTLRADFELCDTYEFVDEPPIAVPMSVFGGLQDVRVGRADLKQWETQAGAGFSLTMFPGSHFFIHGSRDLLLAQLSKELTITTIREGGAAA